MSTSHQLSRRTLLRSAAAGTAALAIASRVIAEPAKDIPIVDTHTHFYNPERVGGVPWPGKGDLVLYRPVLPPEFVKLTKPLGVTGTIVVEASPLFDDNQWLLDLAKDAPVILGIIGNVKPGSDGFPDHIRRLAKNELYRGIRINVGDLRKGLAQAEYVKDLKTFADLGLTLDVNGGPDTPAEVAKLAKEIPQLTICINHCGNVRIDGQEAPADWLAGMKSAAEHTNVFCKVSALVEGTRKLGLDKFGLDTPRDVTFYEFILNAVWNIWGEDRLIYGSNWPVSVRFASYETVLGIVREYFGARPRAIQEKFFAGNAKTAYRWKQR
jgi:predicted TIM-barrel fold metal-dependent hydrolase